MRNFVFSGDAPTVGKDTRYFLIICEAMLSSLVKRKLISEDDSRACLEYLERHHRKQQSRE